MTPKIKLIFKLLGDSFSIREVSDIMRIEPTLYWEKGTLSPKYKVKQENTMWEYEYEFKKTFFVKDVLTPFVKQFEPVFQDIAAYINKNDIEAAIELVVKTYDDNVPALDFDRQFIKLISTLNAYIDIDMYRVNDDEID